MGEIDGINNWPLLVANSPVIPRKDVLLNIDENSGHEGILSSNGQFKMVKGQFQDGIYDDYFGDSGRTNNTLSYDVSSVLNSKVNKAISNADKSSTKLTETILIDIRNKLEVKQSGAERKQLTCSLNSICLFDVINDPTETTDISNNHPEIVSKLKESLEKYREQLMPSRNRPVDPNSNPIYCYDNYFTWLDPNNGCEISKSKKV